MNLLFVTGELAPINGDTARGRNVAHLGGALCLLGHKVTVCTPITDHNVVNQYSLARRLTALTMSLPNDEVDLHVYTGKLPNGVEMWLVDHEKLFRGRPAVTDDEDDPLRHALLAQAALVLAQERTGQGDWHVLHSFSLPGALTSAFKDRFPATAASKTVFSPGNFRHQGRCDRAWVERLGFDWSAFTPDGFEFFGDLNLLKAGLVTAERILLDSPSELLDRCTADGGHGLDGVVRHRSPSLAALLPGLDYSVWNPATDVHVVAHFDAEQRGGKLSCKAQLQHQLGLPVQTQIPLVVLNPPLAQIGPALGQVLERIARQDVQFVAPAGLGEELSRALKELAERSPRRVVVLEEGQENWHALLAGADLLVLDAPDDDGEILLATLRYGALPVVPAQGLAKDIVVDLVNTLESGNGFLVQGNEPGQVQSVIQRALATLRYGKAYQEVQRRGMSLACSWEHRAQQVEQLYSQLLPPIPEDDPGEDASQSCTSPD